MEDNKSNIQNNKEIDANQLNFLKVDQAKKRITCFKFNAEE